MEMQTKEKTVSAEEFLQDMPLEAAWPQGMDADQAIEALAAHSTGQGKTLVGDLLAALYDKLSESIEKGIELTAEQRDFYETESQRRDSSPLYQKPRPF